ncbi:sialin-like [Thrips palmi]|uniref:Sialin-like n=1 Tax=Thrips palmi TaxID=161013 RepID=A0A6P8Z5G2_THRPL|nr:sialin-like [Thrips palmi]
MDGSAAAAPSEERRLEGLLVLQDGDFEWDEGYQGFILSGFFYGYAVGQLPGGLLAERLGGKLVFGVGTLGTALLTIASPFLARAGGGWFFAVRLLEGLFEGVTFPAIQYMISKWAPPAERSRFATVYTGGYLGTVICMPVSGLLCDMDFLSGWPMAFYVFGALGVLWYIPWHLCVFDTPAQHPRIDPREREYIENALGKVPAKKKLAIPWGKLLRTPGLWACASMHLGIGWAFFTLLTCLPTYMSEILHFDIKSNSALSAIPYVAGGTASVVFGLLLDLVITREYVSKLTAYKIFNGITALGPALTLILVTVVGCDTVSILVLLAFNGLFLGAQYTGNSINLLLLAPNFSGTMLGISNTFANGAGILAPYAVGILTNNNQTITAWNIVFYISAGIGVVTYIVYLVLCQGEVQPWNDPEQSDTKSTTEMVPASDKLEISRIGIENPAYQA